MTRSIRLQLDRAATSAATARRQVRALIRGSSTVEQEDDALVIVSELVTNAVVHGREPMSFQADLWPDMLRLEAFDSDSGFERVAIAVGGSDDHPGGRGLFLVDALADGWGVDACVDGKYVWATLSISGVAAARGRD